MEDMMSIDRRVLIARVGALVTTLAASPLRAAGNSLRVHGGKLNWQADLPGTWWGGSAADIERVMRTTNSEPLRDIMRKMLPMAKDRDIYFTNPDVSGTATQVLSTIEGNVLNLHSVDLADADARKELWKQFPSVLANSGEEGSQFTLQGEKAMTTGGAKAYSAVFVGKVRDGTFYEQVHLVDRGQGQWHYLKLQADVNKYRARAQEFGQMLDSIKYG
jgi:hypothetical protein